jgi:hypothetical protein
MCRIRCQVTRRKVSAGTRSDAGRDCRDAFLGLVKTCAKHGVAFWDYLGTLQLVRLPHPRGDALLFLAHRGSYLRRVSPWAPVWFRE